MKVKLLERMAGALCILLSIGLVIPLAGMAFAAEPKTAAKEEKLSCSCPVHCEPGAITLGCSACRADTGACTGKEDTAASDLSLRISPPSGWATKSAMATVRITDLSGNGFKSAQVRIDKNGHWQDITDELEEKEGRYSCRVELSENGTLYLSAAGYDGKVYEKSRYIECFDRTAPTLRASSDGKLLRAEADDALSGVAAITIDGKAYTELSNGTLDIPLSELDGSFAQFSIQAVDNAGNKSKAVLFKNPAYQELAGSPAQGSKPASAPSSPAASAPAVSVPAVSPTIVETPKTEPSHTAAPLTPDGQGEVLDYADKDGGKEFYTISTPDENVFYLVIDHERDTENVYFLNAVTESDLMALAVKEEPPAESAIPEPEPVCSCKSQCLPGAVDTGCPVCILNMKGCTGEPAPIDMPEPEPEPKKEKEGGSGLFFLVLLAALAAGGAGYYFKIYLPKKELDDAEDFDELTAPEEETVNEDEGSPEEYSYEEPEEP